MKIGRFAFLRPLRGS